MENKLLDQSTKVNDTSDSNKPFDAENASETPSVNATKTWLKRVGVGGFLFFLGKGLLWLFLGKQAMQALCN